MAYYIRRNPARSHGEQVGWFYILKVFVQIKEKIMHTKLNLSVCSQQAKKNITIDFFELHFELYYAYVLDRQVLYRGGGP